MIKQDTNQICLFSAPYSFLPDQIINEYKSHMPTVFREIWKRDDLAYDEGVIVWVMNPGQNFVIDDSILDFYPNLKILSTPSTGSNHINRIDCEQRNIEVFCLLDDREILNSISASAEFTFLLLLNSMRRLDFSLPEVSEGRWRAREDDLRGHELSGKNVGIIGLGRIGSRMARYCRAFDASVAYYDPYVHNPDIPNWSLEDIFSKSDAVCTCCSLTEETTGMINYDLLKRLNAGASYINTSRGEVINETDLVRVLSERPDIKVGLDVLAGEVTNTHHASPLIEFHRNGQIVITPHIAGATIESQSKAAIGALRLLQKALSA